MNIYILSSGKYGSRIVNHIAKSFSSSIVGIHEVSEDLPEFIDDVSIYMPDNLPEADLVIAVGLIGDINLLTLLVAEGTGAKSILVSVHDPKGMPPGLMQEIKETADDKGLVVVFAKPFCILQPMGDPFIDEFAGKLGKPVMEIEFDDHVKSVKVVRDAPCGCTTFIAEELVGAPVEEAEHVADIKFHNYPCQASMSVDRNLGDTILHIAGYQSKEAVRRALGFSMKSAVVDLETCNTESEECDHLCVDSCPQVKAGVDTILIGEDNKAVIDPFSCGCCEQCLDECPYGSIEIVKKKFNKKDEV